MHPIAVILLALFNLTAVAAVASAETRAGAQIQGQADSSGDSYIEKPRWEVGVAAAAIGVPAYPSSSVTNDRGFVVPWFIYRGDTIRLREGGLQVIALENKRLTLGLSLGGSLSANSDITPLREGMPNLDYLFEFGPQLDYRIWDRELGGGERSRLNWQTSLRAAVSTDFSAFRSRGLVLSSEVSYRRDNILGTRATVFLSAGPTWAAEKFMDFFYQVDPQFVTAQRAAFDAEPGYLGTDLVFGLSTHFSERLQGFIGLGTSLHDGAANNDSPLFEDSSTHAAVIGLSWQLKKSRRSVRVLDE
ncbi:hypothetical protein AB833_06300 [Chromatiales bacterium (ex Bugula neritina AB1)]|nr:hypothetical protein AB833_06300 [Chromatiales bacterium (ex Bugula neritina AB1)]